MSAADRRARRPPPRSRVFPRVATSALGRICRCQGKLPLEEISPWRFAMTVDALIPQLEAMVASGAAFEDVLEAAVEGLHASNPRFHWTGIYELFPDNVLRLGPFVG